MSIVCRVVSGPEEMTLARSIRREVFVREQGVPEDLEMDEFDGTATHMLAYMDGRAVATGRLVRTAEGVKLGRIAVLRDYRGLGVGSALTLALVSEAGKHGDVTVYGNAQISAMGFYEGLGFRAVGDEFMEAGIRHIRMEWCRGNDRNGVNAL